VRGWAAAVFLWVSLNPSTTALRTLFCSQVIEDAAGWSAAGERFLRRLVMKISHYAAGFCLFSLALSNLAWAEDSPAATATVPPAQAADIVATAVAAGNFKTLAAALKAGGLITTLRGKGPFTVFAPTDEAFAKLPPETLQSLLKPENKAQLVAILTYHVVPGKVMARDVVKLSEAKTVQGSVAKIRVSDGKVKVDNANVVKTDIECANGVIHVIDAVILPK